MSRGETVLFSMTNYERVKMMSRLANDRIALLSMILILCNIAVGQPRRATATRPGEIGRSAVFNPPQVVWGRMQEECQGPNSVECVASIMKQAGASPQAIAFARMLKGDGYMDSFREMGGVDLTTAFFPFRANTNGGTFLVRIAIIDSGRRSRQLGQN